MYRLINERFIGLSEKISDMKNDIITSVNKLEVRQISSDERLTKLNSHLNSKISLLERDMRAKTLSVEKDLQAEIDKLEERTERQFALKHELYPIRLAVYGGIGALGLSIIGLFFRVVTMQAHP